jgi:hypothetical protein
VGEAELYGWVNMEVSADGTTVTVYDWAFNSQPQGQIKAGQTDNTGIGVFQGNNIRVSPNPFYGEVVVNLDKPVPGTIAVEILNLCGEVVYADQIRMAGNPEFVVKPEGLASGVYILKVVVQGEVLTQKMVCQ